MKSWGQNYEKSKTQAQNSVLITHLRNGMFFTYLLPVPGFLGTIMIANASQKSLLSVLIFDQDVFQFPHETSV